MDDKVISIIKIQGVVYTQYEKNDGKKYWIKNIY